MVKLLKVPGRCQPQGAETACNSDVMQYIHFNCCWRVLDERAKGFSSDADLFTWPYLLASCNIEDSNAMGEVWLMMAGI